MRRLILLVLILSLALAASACTTQNPSTPDAADAAPGVPLPTETGLPTADPTPARAAARTMRALARTPAPTNPTAPEIASYDIQVTLDPQARALTGRQVLTYRNATQKPIPELVFHLYLNAFKSRESIFMKESGGQLRGFPFDPQSGGWIDVTAIRLVDGPVLRLEPLEDGTLARAALPRPVAPGETVQVELAFTAQLPRIFARTGWVIDQKGEPFFLVAQWFPKAGVWTEDGWRADPFHANAEFFADFGVYQVAISLPAGYVTGATGLPVETTRSGAAQTVTYRAEGVIDFAWVASPRLETATQEHGGRELVYLYLPEHEGSAGRVFETAALALDRFSDWFGPYPYPRLTMVDVPEEGGGAGGMEYPTFITLGAHSSDNRPRPAGFTDYLSVVVVHEVAHQWFQSMLATDEGREPWLDEGFADYATTRFFLQEYGLEFDGPQRVAFAPGFLQGRRGAFLRDPSVPMHGPAWEFEYGDYVIAAYAKPGFALLTLENVLGEQTMLAILRAYYARYRYSHPTTADFERVAVEVSGQPLDWFFDGLVYGSDTLNYTAQSIEGQTVTIESTGEIDVPVDVLVTLEGGAKQTVTCAPAGAETECAFTFDRPVESVMVDPERKLLIDTDWKDNQLPRGE